MKGAFQCSLSPYGEHSEVQRYAFVVCITAEYMSCPERVVHGCEEKLAARANA